MNPFALTKECPHRTIKEVLFNVLDRPYQRQTCTDCDRNAEGFMPGGPWTAEEVARGTLSAPINHLHA